MPSDYFIPGDTFALAVELCYRGDDVPETLPLFVVLNVYGEVYFAPDFTRTVSYYEQSIVPGLTIVEIIPAFPWPEGAGSAVGVTWFAALTDPGMTGLVGEMDMATFGWGVN